MANQLDIEKDLAARLVTFIVSTLIELESHLRVYEEIFICGSVQKDVLENLSGSFQSKLIQYISGGVGLIGGAFVGYFSGGLIDGAEAGRKFGLKLGGHINNQENKKKCKKIAWALVRLLKFYLENPTDFRHEVIRISLQIFQSFEKQFRGIRCEPLENKTMEFIAKDAVNRMISCCYRYEEEKDVSLEALMVHGITCGKSANKIFGLNKVFYKCGNDEKQVPSESVFETTGLLKGNETYKRINEKNTTITGYRPLLPLENENWNELQKLFKKSNSKKSKWSNSVRSRSGATHRSFWNQMRDQITKFITSPKEDQKVLPIDLNECELLIDENFLTQIKAVIMRQITNENDPKWKERQQEVYEMMKTQISQEIEEMKVLNRFKEMDRGILTSLKSDIDGCFEQLKKKIDDFNAEYHEGFENMGRRLDKIIHQNEENIQRMVGIVNTSRGFTFRYMDLYEQVDSFTGREQELKDLHDKVQKYPKKKIVITGLGKIGKSRFVRQYYTKYISHYERLYFVSSKDESSFIKLAKDTLKLSTKDGNLVDMNIDSICQQVYEVLSDSNTLIIFDGADNIDVLKSLLPQTVLPPCKKELRIVITSRLCNWDRTEYEVFYLSELTVPELSKLVKDELGIKDNDHDDDIESLLGKVRNHTWCVWQAINSIKNGGNDYTINDYLTEFNENTRLLLSGDDELFTDDDNWGSWKKAVTEIREDPNGELALDILNITPLFTSNEEVNELCLLELEEKSSELIEHAVNLLVQYSLVKDENKKRVLLIRKLVQGAINVTFKKQDKENDRTETTIPTRHSVKFLFPLCCLFLIMITFFLGLYFVFLC